MREPWRNGWASPENLEEAWWMSSTGLAARGHDWPSPSEPWFECGPEMDTEQRPLAAGLRNGNAPPWGMPLMIIMMMMMMMMYLPDQEACPTMSLYCIYHTSLFIAQCIPSNDTGRVHYSHVTLLRCSLICYRFELGVSTNACGALVPCQKKWEMTATPALC